MRVKIISYTGPKLWFKPPLPKKLANPVLLGCDTTSRVHGIGKPAASKKILTSDYFHTLAQTMNRGPGTPKEEIVAAGEQALVCLYNGKPGESLDASLLTLPGKGVKKFKIC